MWCGILAAFPKGKAYLRPLELSFKLALCHFKGNRASVRAEADIRVGYYLLGDPADILGAVLASALDCRLTGRLVKCLFVESVSADLKIPVTVGEA